MSLRSQLLLIITSLLLIGSQAAKAEAAVIHVPGDYATIQAAINAAINGDTIQVAPGTYVENINFLGKAIQVTSDQGAQVTTIDGNQAGPVVSFISGEGPQALLIGFTLRNGRAANSPALRGGGIRIENSSPTIRGNTVTNNTAGDGGGGISSSFGSPLIVGNTISNNGQIPGWSGGVGGGGIAIVGASAAQLLNNTISGNSWSSSSGGGITMFAAGTPVLKNNFITNNTAYADPLFRDRGTGDYHLQPGSPAIDAGTSDGAPAADLDGRARPLDGNDDGIAAVDMGAYEAQPIDLTAPITSATSSPNPNSAGWNKTNTTVTLTATDSGSGVHFIRYWLSGAQTAPTVNGSNPAPVTITAEGTTTVGYSAIDNTGNAEVSKSFVVNLDKTVPVISGMPAPGCTLSPPKHQLVQVATVTASDAVSGLATLTVTATSNESESGTGGGDVPGDIVINDGTVQLRAERSPSGKGRTYTIVVAAMDVAGNVTTSTATCQVPK